MSRERIGSLELDRGNVYRILRGLEKKGIIKSKLINYRNAAGCMAQSNIYYLSSSSNPVSETRVGEGFVTGWDNFESVINDSNLRQARFLNNEKSMTLRGRTPN